MNTARQLSAAIVLISAIIATYLPSKALAKSERQVITAHLSNTIAHNLTTASNYVDDYNHQVWMQHALANTAPFKSIPEKERVAIAEAAHRYGHALKIRPDLIMSVIQIESGFDRYALSVAGAHGLMQVMPFWLDALERKQDNLNDIDMNIRWGTAILAHYIDIENGDLARALQRYNGNRKNYKYASKVMSAWQDYWYTGETMPWYVADAH